MKKIHVLSVIFVGALLASCGTKKVDSVIEPIKPESSIQTSAQAAQVCAPFLKYLECTLSKASPAKKDVNKKILEETKNKIEKETPSLIAQQCDTYIRLLNENADIVFKNGCTLEGDVE